jgi:hypothetical protein
MMMDDRPAKKLKTDGEGRISHGKLHTTLKKMVMVNTYHQQLPLFPFLS